MSSKSNGLDSWERIAVPAKVGFTMIGVSHTRGYELIAAKEIDSYHDGRARKLIVESLRNYVERRHAAEFNKTKSNPTEAATRARQARRAAVKHTSGGAT